MKHEVSSMPSPATITLDLHGKNAYQARIAIDAALRRAGGAYCLRLIHGYHGGTALRDMIAEHYAAHPKVLRLHAVSEGITELVLRRL
ncbi:MAG: Smr/MutS family protein [Ruthenibacterium sp.]